MAAQVCAHPIWVDLKGKDALPETVHHTLVRVDPNEDATWLQSTPEVWTDNVHLLQAKQKAANQKGNSKGKGGPSASPSPDTSSATSPVWPGPNDVGSKDAMSEAVKRLKPRVLLRIIDAHAMEQCLIFCRTNFDCDLLERFLNNAGGGKKFGGKTEGGLENPYSCLVLAGARSMQERRRALAAFKDGDIRFLICTDVAARGIDVQGLPYVINMCLPDMPQLEDYIHRVGRVGRAETMGLAISLVSQVPEKVWYCSKKGYKPWFAPTPADVRTNDAGGHTKWYDERALLSAIEKRLGQGAKVLSLNADMSLPPSLVKAAKGGYGRGVGGAGGGGHYEESRQRVEQLRPQVQVLAGLEVQAQRSFFYLRSKWKGAHVT